jgi:hypothetical protein
MARVAMVTRTIVTAEVDVLCMNIESLQVETKHVSLLGGVSDETTMLNKAKTQLETPTLKAVHITKVTELETLYGLTEEDFVKLAKELPPRKGQTDNSEPQPEDTLDEPAK